MKKLKLSLNKFALVDDKDFQWLNQWKWTAEKHWYTFYAHRRDQNRKKIYLHRFITKTKKGEIVDHVNRNGLDNRRINLRKVTATENNYNQKIRKDNNSGHKGIWWNKDREKWVVEIWKNNKKYYFGGYKELKEAILIRNYKFSFLTGII